MSEPTAPSPAPQGRTAGERRAWVRFPRRLRLLRRCPGEAGNEMVQAQVHDVSAGGVRLIFDWELPAKTVLLVHLPSSTLGWTSRLVRVRHVELDSPGRFRVGCEFLEPLTPELLQALLA